MYSRPYELGERSLSSNDEVIDFVQDWFDQRLKSCYDTGIFKVPKS